MWLHCNTRTAPNPFQPNARIISAVNPMPVLASWPSFNGSSVQPPSSRCRSSIHLDAAERFQAPAGSGSRSCNAWIASAVLRRDPKLPRGPCKEASPRAGRRTKCCKCRWRWSVTMQRNARITIAIVSGGKRRKKLWKHMNESSSAFALLTNALIG